jgi:hypothetical protein
MSETTTRNPDEVIGIQVLGNERRGFSFAPIFECADIETLEQAQEFAKRLSTALSQARQREEN